MSNSAKLEYNRFTFYNYLWLWISDHGLEAGDEVGGAAEEPVARAVVDHDEVRVVAVQRHVLAVADLHVAVVPSDISASFRETASRTQKLKVNCNNKGLFHLT